MYVCVHESGRSSGSVDIRVKVWDMSSGICVSTLAGHTNAVCSVCAIDERRIVSGSVNSTVKVWDVSSGMCIWILAGHTNVHTERTAFV